MFESDAIENKGSWIETNNDTPKISKLLSRQSSKGRRVNSSKKKRGVLYHLMLASDPVNAVAGGSNWSEISALREIASRTRKITLVAVAEAAKDDPLSTTGKQSFSDICAVLEVGLVIDHGGLHIVKTCEAKNVILTFKNGIWEPVEWCKDPVSESLLPSLLKKRCLELANDASTPMQILRTCAAFLQTPCARSKKDLAEIVTNAAKE